MSASQASYQAVQNHLLGMLAGADRQRLLPDLEPVSALSQQPIMTAGEPFAWVYFPTGGLYSLLVRDAHSPRVDIAIVGNEGVLGLPAFLGLERSQEEIVCNVAGGTLRMALDALRQHARDGQPLHQILLNYTGVVLAAAARHAACNSVHAVEPRLARWLLQVRDRVGMDEFAVLPEILGYMMAEEPARLAILAEGLQRRGAVRYQDGHIAILDRPQLEAASCDDYRSVRLEYERVLGPIWSR